jgi:hypothetical protein
MRNVSGKSEQPDDQATAKAQNRAALHLQRQLDKTRKNPVEY